MSETIKAEVVIVGAGPAGLCAATLPVVASRSVVLIDDNPRPGGQIWRAEKGRTEDFAGRMIQKLSEHENFHRMPGTQVFGVNGKSLLCESPSGVIRIEFEKLIIATGARELLLPFPGWTLPNVFGAGGLQALVKGGLDVSGKRIVIAGTGPLLLAVANYLRSKGARVLLIAEQAPRSRILRFGLGLWRSPLKLFEAISLAAKLLATRSVYDSYVIRAEGDERLRSVTARIGAKTETIECDMLGVGFHLVPNTELAELLGCEIKNGAVVVDKFQRTTVENVWCAGESTGISGVEGAMVEGNIVAGSVGGSSDLPPFFWWSRLQRRFADRMNRCYELREELRHLADDDTIVCRCEDATFGEMSKFDSFRAAKLQTRCGMGACRGRICGSASRFLFGWEPDSARPPIFPVRVSSLAGEDQSVE